MHNKRKQKEKSKVATQKEAPRGPSGDLSVNSIVVWHHIHRDKPKNISSLLQFFVLQLYEYNKRSKASGKLNRKQ